MLERKIKRYSAYYMGWCQAFGEHEVDYEDNANINWLYGEETIGMALQADLRRTVFKELLGKNKEEAQIRLSNRYVRINNFEYFLRQPKDQEGVSRIISLLKSSGDVHLYLTSHFCYPPGTRIITFSQKKPLFILYKEIAPLAVRVFDSTAK